MFFISQAWAQEVAAVAGQSAQPIDNTTKFIFQIVLIFLVIYLFFIRPQNRKVKQHEAMLKALGRKDKIVLGGGIVGTIDRVENDSELIVEIADGVRIKVLRDRVTGLYEPEKNKGPEPLVEDIKPAKKAKKEASKADALKDVLTSSEKKK